MLLSGGRGSRRAKAKLGGSLALPQEGSQGDLILPLALIGEIT